MATKNITDKQVVEAYLKRQGDITKGWPHEILMQETGECEKVCYRACERAERRGYIDCGVTLRSGFVTEEGLKLVSDKR